MIDIYLATSPSGKGYVGYSTRGVAKRWSRHIQDAKNGSQTALHRAMRKYGAASFRLEVIDRVSTVPGAARAEQVWIRELGTFAGGYNLTTGGDGNPGGVGGMRGKRHREETIIRMRAVPHGPNRGRLGQKCSAETLAKMRAAAAGRDMSAVTAARQSRRKSAQS